MFIDDLFNDQQRKVLEALNGQTNPDKTNSHQQGVAEDDAGDVEQRMLAKMEKEKQRLVKLKQTDPEAYKREMDKRKTSGRVPPVSTFEGQGAAEGQTEGEATLAKIAAAGDEGWDMIYDGINGLLGTEAQIMLQDMYDDVSREYRLHPDDDFEEIQSHMMDRIQDDYGQQGVAEAGNKPLEKSRFGTGDTRTPRDIKSQMQGASDEFVRSTADKKTGPFHSKVAKMQGKMAKSELRRREQGVAEVAQYDLDDYYNARGAGEYGKGMSGPEYGGYGHGHGRKDTLKGQTKNLPADPFSRTSGVVFAPGKGRVHRIALPHEIDGDDETDRKNVTEGSSDYVGNAIEDLRMSMPGLDRETFLDELYTYLDARYNKHVADMTMDHGIDEVYDEWYENYKDLNESDPSGLIHAARHYNRVFIVTAHTAEGNTRKFRVRAQSERLAREKFSQHFNQAKIVDIKDVTDISEEKPGLWANIHAKRKRIKQGSGEKMRRPGSKGAPTAQNFKDAAKTSNESSLNEIEKNPEPEQQQIDVNRMAALRREREPAGSEKIDAMLAQQNAKRQEYEQSGKFWLKQKDTQQHISDAFVGKSAANRAALELLKQRPELKGNLVITAWGPGEQPTNESVKDQPRIRKYSKMRPDGSKSVRYEVLDYKGARLPGQGLEGFDDIKNAKNFYYRNYDRLVNPMGEDLLFNKLKKSKIMSKLKNKNMLESKKRYWCSTDKRWKSVGDSDGQE